MSGLKGAYSSTSTSPTTKRTFFRPAAAALLRASSISRASRSTPTTARARGASVSASRPAPVPTSSTVCSPRGSASRSSRKAGLSPSAVPSPGDGALDRARDVEHLAHAGAALRPLVADHDEVARLEPAGLHRDEGVLLAVEHAGLAAENLLGVARELGHAPLGSEIAAQNRETAVLGDRLRQRPDDLL